MLKSLHNKLTNSIGFAFARSTFSLNAFIDFILPNAGFALYQHSSLVHSFSSSSSYMIGNKVSSSITPSIT